MSEPVTGPTTWTRLPCGCRYATVSETFVIEACALGEACAHVQYAMQVSREAGNPVAIIDDPER